MTKKKLLFLTFLMLTWGVLTTKVFSGEKANYEHDIKLSKILTKRFLKPDTIIIPSAIAVNVGLNTETFTVACEIFEGTENIPVYNDTVTVNDLESFKKDTLVFNGYLLTSSDQVYTVKFTSLLESDENHGNDTLSQYVYSYSQEKELVVVEIGTGVACGWCIGAALGAEDLVENGDPVAILEYHAYNGNDPFENAASLWRAKSYYTISSFPTTYFDGTTKHKGGSLSGSIYDTLHYFVTKQYKAHTGILINFDEVQTTGKDFKVKVMVNKIAPILDDNLYLHVALTESHIPYDWQNQNEINFTVRKMLNDGHGKPINLINNDQIIEEIEFELNTDWEPEHMEVVAFVQKNDSKEILNGHKENLLAVGKKDIQKPATDLSVFPNPAKDHFNFQFFLNKPQIITIQMMDTNGKIVERKIHNQFFDKGIHRLHFNLSGHYPAGLYLIKLITNEGSFLQKLMIQ